MRSFSGEEARHGYVSKSVKAVPDESAGSGLVLKYQTRDVWYKCYERGPRVAVLIQYTPVLVVYKGEV